MIGITIKLKNEYNNFLFKILDKIGAEDFVWHIYDNEIIYKNNVNHLNTSIFQEDILDGTNFLNCIKIEKYYLVYADIKAYRKKKEITFIETYKDFLESSCEIALFCSDTTNIEVYCKDEDILRKIIENCKYAGLDDFYVITKGNNYRTNFSI